MLRSTGELRRIAFRGLSDRRKDLRFDLRGNLRRDLGCQFLLRRESLEPSATRGAFDDSLPPRLQWACPKVGPPSDNGKRYFK